MNKLRLLRTTIASIILVAATLLFLDFTGTLHSYIGWVAKVQFIPALLATHAAVIIILLALTLIFGRLYCSVICPLGLFQDAVSKMASISNKKRKFKYTKAHNILRYTMLALMIIAFFAGAASFVALLDPYGAFGRIVSALLSPLYKMGNNILADFAQSADSYAFYSVEVIWMSVGVIAVACLTAVGVGILAWRNGRTYCNTICPVGTILGFVSRFSLLKIRIDHSKCNGCQKCARNCKSACIEPKTRDIDYSRCVTCFDCIDSCNKGAISYSRRGKQESQASGKPVDSSKRNMLAVTSALAITSALKAEEKLVDGGLAAIEGKKAPKRHSQIVPAGAVSQKNFATKCVGCQLCVTVCPSNVLRPSTSLMNFMQPEMSYEVGFCRPECNKCSQVCPAGAINPIELPEKVSTRIGCAVIKRDLCVISTDGVQCESCATHCPVGAITLIEAKDKEKYGDLKIPTVQGSRCIGCGACENLCPARPFSAIYVEGLKKHITI
ncbi:MAG: 4Fe-4S dicluster domain-containing protein [Rikenellaceae bacterium]